MSSSRKYQLPDFLAAALSPASYDRWLQRKAATRVRRDRERGNTTASIEAYKLAIHRAVVDSPGYDYYTGEPLNWSLISTYNNGESRSEGRRYKAGFALLPTVDHVGDGLGDAEFKVCAWRTNDAKNDLTHSEFVELCRRVVAHFDSVRSLS